MAPSRVSSTMVSNAVLVWARAAVTPVENAWAPPWSTVVQPAANRRRPGASRQAASPGDRWVVFMAIWRRNGLHLLARPQATTLAAPERGWKSPPLGPLPGFLRSCPGLSFVRAGLSPLELRPGIGRGIFLGSSARRRQGRFPNRHR